MRNIQTLTQLHDLQTETFIYAAVVAIAIFALSFLAANLTPYQGGNDRSYIKRRIWLIVCMILGALGFWLYNDLYVSSYIEQVAFKHQFATTNLECLGITLGGSLVISLIVMFVFRHSKFGSILGKEKK